MNDLYAAIQALQKRLGDAGIASVVIDGVAVGLWGEPRATRDADLKVLIGREEADRLLAVLTPDYVSLLPDPHRRYNVRPWYSSKAPMTFALICCWPIHRMM